MSNYKESKAALNKIRSEYSCKGDVIFTTAMSNILEYGANNFNDDNWYRKVMDDIDRRHDKAEAEDKILFITRDFEKAIVDCSKAIAAINVYDLMVYIQREMYLNNGMMDGEPSYQRALQIIRNCLCYTSDSYYGAHLGDNTEILRQFREMELDDDEIAYFGWEHLLEEEEE